jgi:membrane associated rhomboid family serine protease
MPSHRHRIVQFNTGWSEGRLPLVTVLIVLNVAAFILQILLDNFLFPRPPYFRETFTTEFFGLSREGISKGYYWQFLTYMFLHGNLLHILANMLGLYFAGRQIEAILGRFHLLGIYFLGGFAGGVLQMAFSSGVLIGASVGVMATVLAFTTILPELEVTALIFFIIPLRVRAKYLGWGLAGASAAFLLLNTLGIPIFGGWGHAAHLGGCLVGWGYIKQLGYGNPLRVQRYIFEKRQRDARFERMPPGQFISEEIDPILEKISREGIHSLTRREKKILERGRDKIAQRTSGSGHHI